MTVTTAKIHFNDCGVPVAEGFEDVYFSNQDGLAESRYVFLHANELPQRWYQPANRAFVIAETGFGTGLNFLATWQALDQITNNSPPCRLHFISIEQFPLCQTDLEQALACWPQLAAYAKQLIRRYPALVEGCHRLEFDNGSVILDLWIGDVKDVLPAIYTPSEGLVDAWYLDGFAPSKNPQMWNDELYKHMARLSKHAASFATFTAAGVVKRGLASHGFKIEKIKGFGTKREMLRGTFSSDDVERQTPRCFYRPSLTSSVTPQQAKVTIIGGGLAAANLAYSLVRKGIAVRILCKDKQLAGGASGNPQGGFYPQLNAEASLFSQIQAIAFEFARRRYDRILDAGFDFSHQWCGVIQLAFNHKVAQRQQLLLKNQCWPESLISYADSAQCSAIANIPLPYPGLFIANGGWICPPQLVTATIAAAQQIGECELIFDADVEELQKSPCGWRAITHNREFESTSLVIASGAQSSLLSVCRDIPFMSVRGQVEAIPTQAPLNQLRTVLCHKGYLTPEFNGAHALGSTYVKHDESVDYRQQEQDINRETHTKALKSADWVEDLMFSSTGRASIRSSLPDHLPAVGNLFDKKIQAEQFSDLYKAQADSCYPYAQNLDNLFVLAGLGSRGLTTAPLMAELLAAQIAGDPLPLDVKLLAALSPNRFLIKQLVRRQLSD